MTREALKTAAMSIFNCELEEEIGAFARGCVGKAGIDKDGTPRYEETSDYLVVSAEMTKHAEAVYSMLHDEDKNPNPELGSGV